MQYCDMQANSMVCTAWGRRRVPRNPRSHYQHNSNICMWTEQIYHNSQSSSKMYRQTKLFIRKIVLLFIQPFGTETNFRRSVETEWNTTLFMFFIWLLIPVLLDSKTTYVKSQSKCFMYKKLECCYLFK